MALHVTSKSVIKHSTVFVLVQEERMKKEGKWCTESGRICYNDACSEMNQKQAEAGKNPRPPTRMQFMLPRLTSYILRAGADIPAIMKRTKSTSTV